MLVMLIYIKQTAFFVTIVFLLVLDVRFDHHFIQTHGTHTVYPSSRPAECVNNFSSQ